MNAVDVIFSFTNRATDVVEKQFLRVDVTEEFPFLVTKMSPYYDRWTFRLGLPKYTIRLRVPLRIKIPCPIPPHR
jgi:hypothetical protein